MSAYMKAMQAGSAMHTSLSALADGLRFAGSIAAHTGLSTKNVFGYLQSHEARGNVTHRHVWRKKRWHVQWRLTARGRRSLAGAR